MRVTIAVSEELIEAANQLAKCIGLSAADEETYTNASWQDANGNLYAVASAIVSESFVNSVMGELVEPEWGCNLEQAQLAQALIRMDTTASPNTITAVVNDDAYSAISVLGITPIAYEI